MAMRHNLLIGIISLTLTSCHDNSNARIINFTDFPSIKGPAIVCLAESTSESSYNSEYKSIRKGLSNHTLYCCEISDPINFPFIYACRPKTLPAFIVINEENEISYISPSSIAEQIPAERIKLQLSTQTTINNSQYLSQDQGREIINNLGEYNDVYSRYLSKSVSIKSNLGDEFPDLTQKFFSSYQEERTPLFLKLKYEMLTYETSELPIPLGLSKQWELGPLKQDTIIFRRISFTNAGQSPFEILQTRASCNCLMVSASQFVKPGEDGEISLYLDTTGLPPGPFHKNISIINNSIDKLIIITISASIL